MSVEHWEEMYRRAHQRGLEKIQALQGVACAFHSVIDGLIRLTPESLHPVIEADPELKQAALEGIQGNYPIEIHSPSDFIAGMFHSLNRGSALQLMIREEDTYKWALKKFGAGELRLGGTSANMARSLAPLNIPVTVYAHPLTKELADLFGHNTQIKVIARGDDGYTLMPPAKAAREEGIFAIHWVFDYARDFVMNIDGVEVAPKRANRYIPSWNPRNNQFHMCEEFAEGFLDQVHNYSHLLFSGFHILSEAYPDGSQCGDVVRPLGGYLETVRAKAPDLKIHMEMASIASPKVRDAILNHIFPQVASVGLNEMELPLLLENMGETSLAKHLWENGNAVEFLKAMKIFQERTGLRRIHFHNLGYYICLETEPWHTPSDMRDGLLFAALMAAARAQNGLFSSPNDIEAGLGASIGEVGLEQLRSLGDFLEQPDMVEEGIGEYEGMTVSIVPTKLVQNPVFTVGLGDTISSGAFLSE